VHGKLGSLCPCIKGLLARLVAQVYNPQDIPSSDTKKKHIFFTPTSHIPDTHRSDQYTSSDRVAVPLGGIRPSSCVRAETH
jgi:hypothetical protein